MRPRLVSSSIWIALFSLALSGPARGADAPALTPEQENLAREIGRSLVSPCCWTTSVEDHGSGRAPEIKAEIRRMIAAGKTRDEIIAHYVALEGERILIEPRRSGFNLLAYVTPPAVLLFGAILIVVMARRGRSAPPLPTKEPPTPTDDPYRRRVREELRRLG
jgi:cytochrome c-type biogenesis protein CcmH